MGHFRSLLQKISRRKCEGNGELNEGISPSGPKLLRVLSTFDLILLGVGSTLGVGIYVLAGSVAKDIAGPAVCVSFFIAAVASAISAVCYAEFGARVPKAGSAYMYSYVTVGELVAFIIGWNLILEYLIGTASVARAFSSNIDAISNHSISRGLTKYMPVNIPHLSPFVDWPSFFITVLITVVLSAGVRSSSWFTNIFAFLNMAVVLFVIVFGSLYAKTENWSLPVNSTTEGNLGNGGFFPFGFNGVMAGAARCFFGFVGFDSIAAAAEEAKDAKRSVPLSIVSTLFIVLSAYLGISTVITLMVPYYAQDKDTPLVHAFMAVNQEGAAWIVTIGSLFGLAASLIGAMMPLPRIVYAMAKDGLLFRFLSSVHPRFKTPFTATLVTGILAALFAMLTELEALVDMMSIGTLLAYTLVAVSVLVLRYERDWRQSDFIQMCVSNGDEPTPTTARNSKICIATFCLVSCFLCGFLVFGESLVEGKNGWILFTLAVLIMASVFPVIYLWTLPKSSTQIYFMVPLVPFVPCASIFVNIYLMLNLSGLTWIRFCVWMVIGMAVYVFYGSRNATAASSSTRYDNELNEDRAPLVLNESNES